MKKSISYGGPEYSLKKFDIIDADPDPFRQFQTWFMKASELNPAICNAMMLSTSDLAGRPSSRIVLLKGIEYDGFVFFTNYLSRKAKDLENNPFASLLFFWPECGQQVRIEGKVKKISSPDSSEYFATRPRESQAAAWASMQSETIPDRNYLEDKLRETENQFNGKEIPRPSYWGGYKLNPEYFEFWQGQTSRLHDRIIYSLEHNKWKTERLSP